MSSNNWLRLYQTKQRSRPADKGLYSPLCILTHLQAVFVFPRVENEVYLRIKIKKVKCTLVQALRLSTGRTAHRGSRGIALPFHDYGTRRGWGVSATPQPLFTPGKDPVPIVQVGTRTGLDRCGKSSPPTGIRSPDRPARNQSLYWLSQPAHSV
jgi:hypothetical protein